MFNTLLTTTENGIDWGALLDNIVNAVTSWCLNVGIKLLVGLVVMFIAFKIINKLTRRIEKKGDKEKYDKTLMRTIAYLVRIISKVIIAVCFVAFVGFDISGITALIASFGVAIGLAVNGALANIAGGVLILVTRPFKVDDYIEAQGVSGTVEDIHMVSTKLRTPDNKVIYIPNGALANGNIVNYSVKDIRRVDFTFSISYSSDSEKAKSLVMDILTAHELTLDDPAPFVRMSAHSENGITITARAWTKSGDYWTVNFDVLEAVKAAFDANGIEIPFNQLDVHVKND
ncbi:MAG: mechanosensitive ion channel [Clostridia bacterium]|nr:mechanosensitive ion channel [Clostridia bacterium]